MAGVRIEGLAQQVRALKKLGASTQDLKDIMFTIGNKVVQDVKALTPVRTGRLQGSFRASKTANKAIIRGGRATVPYASFVEFGSVHNTAEHMTERAVKANEQYAAQTLDREIQNLADRLI